VGNSLLCQQTVVVAAAAAVVVAVVVVVVVVVVTRHAPWAWEAALKVGLLAMDVWAIMIVLPTCIY